MSGSLWEADHVKEITDGGDPFEVDNMQTLCVPCHRAKTAHSCRLRAQKRRGILIEKEET